MKKLALLFASSLLFASVGASFNHYQEAKADGQITEYVDFGPGIFNPNQTGTPEDIFRPEVYSIAYRSDAFMFFPNQDIYHNIPFNTTVNIEDYADSDFSLIRIYTSPTEYKTIDYYFIASGMVKYNIYSDASINFALFTRDRALEANDIYKVVINEGFVLPYPVGDHDTKYVIKETLTFVNNSYHHMNVDADIVYAFEWDKQKYTEYDEEEQVEDRIPIAAFARSDENYRVHIRGAHITEEDFIDTSRLNIDDGTCRLLIFFGNNDYNSELRNSGVSIPAGKFNISEDDENSYIHKMYEKVLFHTPEGETLTLKEIADPATKGLPKYNLYGEMGTISFLIGNEGDESLPNYNALSFSSVTILRGAEFPSYRYTGGNSTSEIRYVQMDDITVELAAYKYTKWVTYSNYVFTAANISIDSVSARHVNVNTDDLVLDANVIDLGLSECNYEGTANAEILTIGENMLRYIYINGRSLYHAFNKTNIKAFANLAGKENTISIVIPLDASEITEIIVRRGCAIPSLVASSITMEIYGGYVSYFVDSSVSYEHKNNEFVKASKIYWTLWFEGKNPVRVSHGATYDFDTAPVGESNSKQRFVVWCDEEGEEAIGYQRITSGREYYGKYAYSYDVNFKNIDNEFSIIVPHYTRLTNCSDAQRALNPTRKGFVFQGYVDENGDHYNLNNRITRDITLTAVWVAVEGEPITQSTNSCGGNIVSTSIMLSVISLFGIVLIVCAKSKRNE